jgi:hypothetical protein
VSDAGWRVANASASKNEAGAAKYLNKQTAQGLAVATVSGCLFWLVWIYGNGLRDPRYFDGWALAVAMAFQLYFHIAIKTGSMAPKSASRWRKIHIFLGYVLIAAFVSHTDFSLPDNGLEWALWTGFVLVTLSGLFGIYLAWALKAKGWVDDGVSFDKIPVRRNELAREVRSAVSKTDPTAAALALPAAPFDAWIADLYTNHLRDFFQEQRNVGAHLVGSQRPLKKLTTEIDNLSNYVDLQAQEKLAAIRAMVVEKDRLDFARVYLGFGKGWLFVHVPVTYALTILITLHILVMYSYSSGAM